MKTAGAVLAFGGLMLAAYYLWLYKTYNDAGMGGVFEGLQIVDSGKVETRRNGLVFGVGVAVVGTLLYGFSRKPG